MSPSFAVGASQICSLVDCLGTSHHWRESLSGAWRLVILLAPEEKLWLVPVKVVITTRAPNELNTDQASVALRRHRPLLHALPDNMKRTVWQQHGPRHS